MGVTISCGEKSVDMGYGGFLRLRRTIASLCPEEIHSHYEDLVSARLNDEFDYVAYDKKTAQLINKYRSYRKVINFLYVSDASTASLTYGTAKDLLKLIGDFDDGKIYGYPGWGDKAARFCDFKDVLRECVEKKKPLILS